MKILTVYYSRSGNTEKVAQEIASNLNSDLERINDLKDRERTFNGWLIAGKDASQKSMTEIGYTKNPDDYDLVIIGTPVWAWTMSPAIRAYLNENSFRKVAFFCTYGATKGKTFNHMEQMSEKPLETLDLNGMMVEKKGSMKKIGKFCSTLINRME